jgi:hypothetical protein
MVAKAQRYDRVKRICFPKSPAFPGATLLLNSVEVLSVLSLFPFQPKPGPREGGMGLEPGSDPPLSDSGPF